MALEMRTECERCTTPIAETVDAFICVHECTFCAPCTEEMDNVCPNCGGELVRRPKAPKTACSL